MQFVGLLVAACCVLTALIVFNAARPSPEEAIVIDFSTTVIENRFEDMDPAQQAAWREQWRELSPELQREIFFEVARHRLQELRQDWATQTDAERSARIVAELERMRARRQQASPEQRQHAKERLQSEDGKAMVTNFLAFFREELTSRERAELDPLVHEWLLQINQLAAD